MKYQQVRIEAPSRLHFGLFALENSTGAKFGGAGVMIDRPNVVVEVSSATEFNTSGVHADRAEAFARQWLRAHSQFKQLNCSIQVTEAPPQHVGLGVGTQLGLAVATALRIIHGMAPGQATIVASEVGRGMRSAVGIHGFQNGGLIVEQGKLDPSEISPLHAHVSLPAEWRFVLLRDSRARGIAGDEEKNAFRVLPGVPSQVSDRLRRLGSNLVESAQHHDFDNFSRNLYEFGWEAGQCFSPVQGGPYNGEFATQCVEFVRQSGVAGVSQSSWGPTVFALVRCGQDAQTLVAELRARFGKSLDLQIASPNNCGAQIRVHSEQGNR